MIFKSIRWRLQVWYGVILLAVLAGFGVTAYQLERGRQFRRIDDELHRRVNAIGTVFRLPPRGPGPPGARFDRPARPDGALLPDEGPPNGGRRAGDLGGGGRRDFQLPPRLAGLFDETDSRGFYFVVLARDGSELRRTTNAPVAVPVFAVEAPEPGGPEPGDAPRLRGDPRPAPVRTRGVLREAAILMPRTRETIIVGRSIAPELADLRRTAWVLTGVGGAILLLGLAGGWWLGGRAIRPVADISAAAQKISAGDLSQRIDISETESELGRLASVLNSTFARLDAAFAQQKQFTSDAAHELRTPVAVMLTQTQTALGRERSVAEYRDTIEACQRSVQRMRRLIESLLELARLDAGQESMNRMPLDLARTARECVELIRSLSDKRRITIRSMLADAPCTGDSERLAQVVTNLLGNAIQYNREGGEVRIATRREPNFAVVEVADDGPGIAAEHLPHIFERFYRADPARAGLEGRSGLGLAISKAIVQAHGGSLDVSSEPGNGSVFTMRIPVAE